MTKASTGLFLCIAAVWAAPALAQDSKLVFTNSSGWSTKLYGHLNMTFQHVDDGRKTYGKFVDNSNSPSRVGLWIDAPAGENRFRFNFETALGIQSTSEQSQGINTSFINWTRTDIRKLEGTYAGRFGAVWAGQGSMAADSITEIDLSGTTVAGYSSLSDTAASYLFRDGDALSGVSVGDVFSNFDGSRRMRVRYDTPEYSGFMFSASYGQEVLAKGNDDNYYDAALRYGYDNDDFVFAAGVGYTWQSPKSGGSTERLIGSGSALHKATGINVTFAAGKDRAQDSNYYYAKLGWIGQPFVIGKTAVSADYYNGSDFLTSGSSSKAWGIQVVQKIDDYNLEGYVSYRAYSYDDRFAGYRDLDAVLVGARWTF